MATPFWFFGHQGLHHLHPGTGLVSTIIATFSGRSIFRVLPIVLSLVSTAFMGFGSGRNGHVYTGPQFGESFFIGGEHHRQGFQPGADLLLDCDFIASGRLCHPHTGCSGIFGFFLLRVRGGQPDPASCSL